MSVLMKLSGSQSRIMDPIQGTFDPMGQVWGLDIFGEAAVAAGTATQPTDCGTTMDAMDMDKDDEELEPDPEG